MEYDTRMDRGAIAGFADRLEVHSRYADLLIIGQPDQAEDVPAAPSPGDIALSAAAPVLVVPYIGLREGFGKRAMIAWNASREVARAVKNAMPFLERAVRRERCVLGADGTSRRRRLPPVREMAWRS